MIVKNHNIVLEDTSPAEMARFRQIFKGIWLQQVEDEKNAVEMEKYIKNSQTGTVNNTFIPVTQVIQIINKFQGEAHPHKTFVDLIDRNFCQPDNKELVAYTDSQGMPREGTIELNWNPFVGIDLRVPSWDINFETGVFHTRFSIKIYEFNSHNIAFEFVVNDYDLLLHLFKLLKIHLEQENVKKLITLYQAKIANAKNDPNKLDVVYETLPNTLYGHIDDVVLYEHLNLILDSVKFSDYTNYIFGGTNEDKAVLNILYAIKNKAELYRKLYEDSQLLYKIYTKLHGEEIQDLLRFLTRLVEEFDKTKPTDIVYFDNTYYLFRDTHVKTNWSGTTITVNNYKDKTELVGTPRAAQNPKELDKMYPPGVQEVYLPKYYILNKSFNPLSKLNFGTKLGELGEQLGDDNTFVIALKLHNMATKQSNWDLFNIATDLLSLLSGAGALRIVLAKGAPVAARILAGVVLAKDATHYAMLSNNTLQKWHDNGYGWLANLWVAFSVTADLASFGLPNLSKIAREGNAAAELAETAEEAKEIKKVADRANDYVKAETGKDVSKMSNKEYDDFFDYLSKWNGNPQKFKKGYLSAKKLSRKEIKEYIKKINVISEGESKLIILPEGHKLLDGNKAGFNPFNGNLYVQKGMTDYEVFHEFKHFEEYRILGKDEYIKGMKAVNGDLELNLIRTYKREKYVFDEIMKNKGRFSEIQLKDAQDYMNRVIKRCEKAGIDINNIK
jgi:hypothetical protein